MVLVCGAGPTGLTTALSLADRGVPVRIVDAAPERSPYSRALVVQPRTLELLERFGLGHELVAKGHAAPRTTLYADGEPVLSVDIAGLMPDDTPFGTILFLSQVEMELALERELNARGVHVERPVQLESFTQDASGVQAVLDGEAIRVDWLVGADGAHSTVRKGLGLSFDGAPYRSDFLLGDVVVDGAVDTDQIHVFLARNGITVLFPLPGERTRLITTDPDGKTGDLPLAELRDKACSKAHRDWRVSDPEWLARFHLHHRGVPRYRVDRCFVAGDAAHIHSPAGGQGMNTGIGDAFNLAFKLAMVELDGADPALLDSYQSERHPVGRKLLAFTDRGFSFATQDAQWFTALRNTVLPWLAPAVATEARQAAVLRFITQTGIRYRRSPLRGESGRFSNTGPRPGERLEDPACRGSSWWLLASGDGALWRRRVDAFAALVPWLRVAWGTPRHGLDGPGLLLVRPDGHLAFRSAGEHLDPLASFVDSLWIEDIDQIRLAFDATGLAVLNGALALIMFGVALDLTVDDLRRLVRDPRGPAVGLLCQFLILPAMGFAIAWAVAPTPSMALGMMLVCACPGGNVSNAITQLAGGRVSVSVGMTAVSTMAAVITTPLNLTLWGSLNPHTAPLVTDVALDPSEVAITVCFVLAIPCALGMAVTRWLPTVADRLRTPMKILSVVFFVVVVAAAFGANLDVFLLAIGTVALPVALLNAAALTLGYTAARVAGLPEPDRRAVSIEVGIQNSGLGLALIFTFFDGLGGMAAVAGWWGIWHILAGLTLAGAWQLRDRFSR